MTSMAKVFVVLNLILAVVAFGSGAVLLGTKDDWKKAAEEMNDKYEKVKTAMAADRDRLENEVAQQNRRAADAVKTAQTAEENASNLDTQLKQAKSINDQLRALTETLSQEVKAANNINKENKDWLDRLSSESKQATQDKLDAVKKLEAEIANRVQLEQQVNQLTESLASAMATKGDLEQQIRELKFWNDEYAKRFGKLDTAKGAAGRVREVMGKLVGISVGSRDGVRTGDKYSLSRGGTFVGTIRITRVEKDLALGLVTSTGSGSPPQVGDTAKPSDY